MNRPKAIILDRDGTIIVERHYLSRPEQVELLPGATAGLRHLTNLGFLLVVTNQSGVGRGYYTESDVAKVNQTLIECLAVDGITLAGVYHCPHRPDQGCACRKPRPGLVERAAAELSFDPCSAIVIGDKPCDIELGQAFGAQTILVRTGYGRDYPLHGSVTPDYIADDLASAAEIIESMTVQLIRP
jgi:histidinol-phosphate phosphatase family protein